MIEIRVIMRQEGDLWAAQCIEYDISAQGRTPTECRRNMNDQLAVEAEWSLRNTGEVFGGIPTPPPMFESHWDCTSNDFKTSDLIAENSLQPEYRMVG